MTVLESILRDLQGMPMPKLVKVARYVHSLSDTSRYEKEREEILRETLGCLNEEEGAAFEEALAGSRRMESKQ